MELWAGFVDLLYDMIYGLSVVFGGNMGTAIAVISFTFRIALLPLTLRLAYRSLATQAALKKLAPQLNRVRKIYKGNPQRIWEETQKLHRENNIRLIDGSGFISVLIQAPLFMGLFSAIRRGLTHASRFLWIKDLGKPDGILALACATLAGISAAVTPGATEQHKTAMAILPALLTFVFLWRIAAGVSIYSFASSLVGLAQAFMVRRRAAQMG